MKANLAHLTNTTFEEKTSPLTPFYSQQSSLARSMTWVIFNVETRTKSSDFTIEKPNPQFMQTPTRCKAETKKTLLRNRVYGVGK
jgi:hypothetical protein